MDGTAGDAASVSGGTDPSRAAVPDPAPAAVPAWVGRAVWRGIWQLIAAVLITAAALWFAGRASDLIGYLVLAQLLAFALEPAVMWLHQRRGWRRGSATGLLLVGILLLFVVLAVEMGAVLADQVDGAAGQLPVWIDKLNAYTQQHFGTTAVVQAHRARRRRQPVHGRAVHLLPPRQRSPDPPRAALAHAAGATAPGPVGLDHRHREDRRLPLLQGPAGAYQRRADVPHPQAARGALRAGPGAVRRGGGRVHPHRRHLHRRGGAGAGRPGRGQPHGGGDRAGRGPGLPAAGELCPEPAAEPKDDGAEPRGGVRRGHGRRRRRRVHRRLLRPAHRRGHPGLPVHLLPTLRRPGVRPHSGGRAEAPKVRAVQASSRVIWGARDRVIQVS